MNGLKGVSGSFSDQGIRNTTAQGNTTIGNLPQKTMLMVYDNTGSIAVDMISGIKLYHPDGRVLRYD